MHAERKRYENGEIEKRRKIKGREKQLKIKKTINGRNATCETKENSILTEVYRITKNI